jgi:hypothetical protein
MHNAIDGFGATTVKVMLDGAASLPDANTPVILNDEHAAETLTPTAPSAPVKPGNATVMVSLATNPTLALKVKLMEAAVDVKHSGAGMLSAVWVSAILKGIAGEAMIGVAGIVPLAAVLTETVSEGSFAAAMAVVGVLRPATPTVQVVLAGSGAVAVNSILATRTMQGQNRFTPAAEVFPQFCVPSQ